MLLVTNSLNLAPSNILIMLYVILYVCYLTEPEGAPVNVIAVPITTSSIQVTWDVSYIIYNINS